MAFFNNLLGEGKTRPVAKLELPVFGFSLRGGAGERCQPPVDQGEMYLSQSTEAQKSHNSPKVTFSPVSFVLEP